MRTYHPLRRGGIHAFVLILMGLCFGLRASEPELAIGGISFPVSYIGEVLANPSGGHRQGAVYEGLLSIGIAGELEKMGGWKECRFLFSGIYPHGPSLTQKYVRDLNAVSNIDAYDTLRLYEAWIEQELGPFSLRVGQILVDTEFFVSEPAALFLNGAFGALPLVSFNLRAPVYPIATPGLRLSWSFSENAKVQLGLFDGDVGDEALRNPHGVDWRLGAKEGILAITELAYRIKVCSLPGTLKIGGYYHTHSNSYPVAAETQRGNAGSYLVLDQELWRSGGGTGQTEPSQVLSGFLRSGGAPANRNYVNFYCDTGLHFHGLLKGRKKDVAGVGFSYTRLSNSVGIALETRHEAIWEATYRFQVNDWFCVQPDCQCIFNPGGGARADTAWVTGIRFTATF